MATNKFKFRGLKGFTSAVKRRWLKDLRSGAFVQGVGGLCDIEAYYDLEKGKDVEIDRTHCCLGVLDKKNDERNDAIDNDFLGTERHPRLLPFKVQRILAGMNDGETVVVTDRAEDDPDAFDAGEQIYNGKKLTFKQIASWIEKNVGPYRPRKAA